MNSWTVFLIFDGIIFDCHYEYSSHLPSINKFSVYETPWLNSYHVPVTSLEPVLLGIANDKSACSNDGLVFGNINSLF